MNTQELQTKTVLDSESFALVKRLCDAYSRSLENSQTSKQTAYGDKHGKGFKANGISWSTFQSLKSGKYISSYSIKNFLSARGMRYDEALYSEKGILKII
jgi:hypothetical protein